MLSTATSSTWRGMGYIRLYFAHGSPCDENKQPYHTGLVTAQVNNKDHAFCRTLGRRYQVCYWCIIHDSWKRHHHRHIEHKDTKSFRKTPGTKWTGTDGTSLDFVKWDGRTLAKQQRRKDTRFSSVEKRINTSMAMDFFVHKDIVNTVMECCPVSSRLITIRLRAVPFNITIV